MGIGHWAGAIIPATRPALAERASHCELKLKAEVAVNRGVLLPWYVIALGTLVLALFVSAPFFLSANPVAQLFFNLILAVITTLISTYATHYYSKNQIKEELTRYGLQAWRTLDSLAVKVSQHLGESSILPTTLQAWILDIDGAKWAWRDLLRELFEIQDRLQLETDEVVLRYKKAIAESPTAQERSELQTKQAAEIANLLSRAPLPVKLPEDVACPSCGTRTTARVGSEVGDTGWPVCPSCKTRFPVFRKVDGKIEGSELEAIEVVKPCPTCGTGINFSLYEDREVSFLVRCPECKTHIQFTGSPEKQELTDLGIDNAKFECPHCGTESNCWLAPGRKVSFVIECVTCSKWVRVIGTKDKFEVRHA